MNSQELVVAPGLSSSYGNRLQFGVESLRNEFLRVCRLYRDGMPFPTAHGICEVTVPTSLLHAHADDATGGSSSLVAEPDVAASGCVTEPQPIEGAVYDAEDGRACTFSPLATHPLSGPPTSVLERIGCVCSPWVGAFSARRLRHTLGGVTPKKEVVADPTCARKIRLPAHRIVEGFLPLAPFLELERSTEAPSAATNGLCCTCSDTGERLWHPSTVVEYDEGTHLYSVQAVINGRLFQKQVSRAALRFGESGEAHLKMIERAVENRRWYERKLRTDLFLELMGTEQLDSMPEGSLQRVLASATQRCGQSLLVCVNEQTQRIRLEYKLAMREVMFTYFAQSAHVRILLGPLNLLWVKESQENDSSCAARSTSRRNPPKPVGPLSTPHVKNIQRCIQKSFLWMNPTMLTMVNVRTVWQRKYAAIRMVAGRGKGRNTAQRLDIDFSQWANKSLVSVAAAQKALQLEYTAEVESAVAETLKGHFTYTYTSIQHFRESSLQAFLRLVDVEMMTRLADITATALQDVRDLFCPPSDLQRCAVASLRDVHSEYVFPGEDPQHVVTFRVFLELNEGSGAVHCDIGKVKSEAYTVVRRILAATSSVLCIENIVMSTLNLPAAYVFTLTEDAPPVAELFAVIEAVASRVAQEAASLAALYAQHACRLAPTQSATCDATVVEEELKSIEQALSKIVLLSPNRVFMGGIFVVDCTTVKARLIEQWEERRAAIFATVNERVLASCVSACQRLEAMYLRLSTRPRTADDLKALVAFSLDAVDDLTKIEQKESREVFEWVRLLESHLYAIPLETTSRVVEMFAWPQSIEEAFARSRQLIEEEKKSMTAQLDVSRVSVRDLISHISDAMQDVFFISEAERADEAIKIVRMIRGLVTQVESELTSLQDREMIVGLPVTEFEELPHLVMAFDVFEQFWNALVDATGGIHLLLDTPITVLAAEKATEDVQQWRRLIRSATRQLRAFPEICALGKRTEAWISQFEAVCPLLESLRGSSLRLTHWKELSRRMGLPMGAELLSTDATLTVSKLINAKIANFTREVEDVTTQAAQEYDVEHRLEKMKSEARCIRLQFIPVGENGTAKVLANGNELTSRLDHFVITSQHLRQSPFVGAHLTHVTEWESSVSRMQDTFAVWHSVQEQWTQLLPVIEQANECAGTGRGLDAPVVLQFVQADASLRIVVDEVDRLQLSLMAVINLESLPQKLSDISAALKSVQTGVMELMDSKRAVVPRLHFVSNQALLSCLSSVDPVAVDSLLIRMYSRLASLRIEGGEVVGFISTDSVTLKADTPIHVQSEPIEKWLAKVDTVLQKSMRRGIAECLDHHHKTPLRQWVVAWSAQLIDIATRICFTKDIKEVLSVTGMVGLSAYQKKLHRVRSEYVEMNRQSRATVKESEARTLTNCVVSEVYHRDVVEQLVKDGVSNEEDLKRCPFLRTEWNAEASLPCTISLFSVSIPYGFEFLGNHCAPSLMAAGDVASRHSLFLTLAGCAACSFCAVEGKAELATEMAAFCGRMLWSVPCLSSTKLSSLLPLIQGSAQVGVWMLLDTIHNLSDDVLRALGTLEYNLSCAKRNKSSLQIDPRFPSIRTIDPNFAVLSTTNLSLEAYDVQLPSAFAESFRPFYLKSPNMYELARIGLVAYGMEEGAGWTLGALFVEGRTVAPFVFSASRLMSVIRAASTSSIGGTAAGKAIVDALRLLVRPLLVGRTLDYFEDAVFRYFGISMKNFPDEAPSSAVQTLSELYRHHQCVVLVGDCLSGKTASIYQWWHSSGPVYVLSPRAFFVWGHVR